MTIYNHFAAMDIVNRLSNVLLNQDFTCEQPYMEEYDRCRQLARAYARVEQALAVLSDLRAGSSDICYGGFARTLGMAAAEEEQRIGSIWEEDILRRIHPDDLCGKYLLELRFFRFVKHLARSRRGDYFLAQKLRMKNAQGDYISVLHRMFYIDAPSGGSIRFALCLYTPLPFDLPLGGSVVDSVTGQTTQLETRSDSGILSEREKQVLRLIARGMMSKQIADTLSISINTVSRHRQQILQKLQVRNSIEACRIAERLGII